ncbi:retention module-containing protein [Salinispirillum sp. LH 10-3-1]|uniref:Retention module-containing protein n=1 Tax=Salinispirillum sp. LH 10-3-1 TaxID=2952525 RepID=A0AB38YIB4_9GAMM
MTLATVVSVTGTAWVRNPDGSLNVLESGTELQPGQIIIAADGILVELDYGDGESVYFRGEQSLFLTSETSKDAFLTAQEAALFDESVLAVLQALEEGGDLLDSLDATAAGSADNASGAATSRAARLFQNSGSGATDEFDFGDTGESQIAQALGLGGTGGLDDESSNSDETTGLVGADDDTSGTGTGTGSSDVVAGDDDATVPGDGDDEDGDDNNDTTVPGDDDADEDGDDDATVPGDDDADEDEDGDDDTTVPGDDDADEDEDGDDDTTVPGDDGDDDATVPGDDDADEDEDSDDDATVPGDDDAGDDEDGDDDATVPGDDDADEDQDGDDDATVPGDDDDAGDDEDGDDDATVPGDDGSTEPGTISIDIAAVAETQTVAEMLATNPRTPISVATGEAGMNFTSMGMMEGGDSSLSVWRLRNGTDEEVTVTVRENGGDHLVTYVLPPNTDTFVTGPGAGTYIMDWEGGSNTKASGNQTFSSNTQVDTGSMLINVTGESTNVAEGESVTVTITDVNGDMVELVGEIGADGSFAFDGIDVTNLADGELTIVATTTDAQGSLITITETTQNPNSAISDDTDEDGDDDATVPGDDDDADEDEDGDDDATVPGDDDADEDEDGDDDTTVPGDDDADEDEDGDDDATVPGDDDDADEDEDGDDDATVPGDDDADEDEDGDDDATVPGDDDADEDEDGDDDTTVPGDDDADEDEDGDDDATVPGDDDDADEDEDGDDDATVPGDDDADEDEDGDDDATVPGDDDSDEDEDGDDDATVPGDDDADEDGDDDATIPGDDEDADEDEDGDDDATVPGDDDDADEDEDGDDDATVPGDDDALAAKVTVVWSNEQTSNPNFAEENSYTLGNPDAWGEAVTWYPSQTGQPGTVKTRFDDPNSVNIDLTSHWNSIKNISVSSEESANVTIDNFVFTQVHLAGDGESVVVVNDAKRGDISTGSGDDIITFNALTNNAGWSNDVKIDAGEGNNTVSVSGSKGHTLAAINTGSGDDSINLSGAFNTIQVTAAGGNNTFDLSAASFNSATINGGNGGSTFILESTLDGVVLVGGTGTDTLQLNLTAEQMTAEVIAELKAFSESSESSFTFTAVGDIQTIDFNGLALFVDGEPVDVATLTIPSDEDVTDPDDDAGEGTLPGDGEGEDDTAPGDEDSDEDGEDDTSEPGDSDDADQGDDGEPSEPGDSDGDDGVAPPVVVPTPVINGAALKVVETTGKPVFEFAGGENFNNKDFNGGHEEQSLSYKNANGSKFVLGHGDNVVLVDGNANGTEIVSGNGNDLVVIGGNGNGSSVNLGGGNNTVVLQGNSYNNMTLQGGQGNDVLYLPGDQSDYKLDALNNNDGVLTGQIKSNGHSMTINNFDLIVFADGSTLGNGTAPVTGEETTVTVDGEAVAGHTVEVYANGELLGTTTADESGNWSFDYSVDGDVNGVAYTAVAIDTDGNRSELSDAYVFNATDVSEPEIDADPAPVLTVSLGDLASESEQAFSSNFDDIHDPNWADDVNTAGYVTTGLQFVSEADGWLPVEDGGVIEIRSVENSASGQQHIELNSSDIIPWAHAPGIMRDVATEAGSEYTLDFQYAARPGYGPDVNVFEVVVDGVVVGTFSADGTGSTAAQWQSGSVTFIGTGEPQTIVLREASDNDQGLGRGMLLDDITLTSTSQRADIQLHTEAADGAEVAYSITGLPEGAGLYNTDGVLVANEQGVWTLTAAQAEGLYMTVPVGTSGEFNIEVTVTATTEQGSQSATETLMWVVGDVVEDTSITVMNLSSQAGYHNSYGFYTKDEDGNPVDGQIIWADVKEKESIGQAVTLDGYAEDDIGFFLISNGGNLNSYTDGDAVTFQQVNGVWVAGTEVNGQFQAFSSDNGGGTYFSDASLNPDGVVKVKNTDDAGNQNWEDMVATGDNDFNDFNVQVVVHTGETDHLVTGTAGSDTLNATQGNSTLIGGLGADTFAWTLADVGSADEPYLDVVADFTLGQFGASSEADRLDLSELLQVENPNDLVNYLHFEHSDEGTVVQISSTGAFTDGSYDAGAVDQTIVLQGIDFSGMNNAEIIQQLLDNKQLLIDN